jgi:hypothetical protein
MMKILVLLTVNDDITLHRIARYQQRPALEDYEIKYCFCKELDEENRRLEQFEIGKIISGFNRRNCYNMLYNIILPFNPDVVIIHAGFIFNMKVRDFILIVEKLKSRFPHIHFGIEQHTISPIAQKEIQNKSKLFDNSQEMDYILENLL